MTSSTKPSQQAPIEIRPEVTMLSVLRHLNYKAWFAMAEFIDNALQSSIANSDQLHALHGGEFQLEVDIKIETSGPGQIIISDNAAGISEIDFPRAFRAAQVPEDRSGLSEFGMGMKSAACWFAEKWSVRTKAIGESVERTIYFDVRNIVENKIESLNTQTREVDPSAHYTVVTLRGLHHMPQGRTVGKIRDHLASIYRVFLRDGRLSLHLNGSPLSYQPPKILNAVIYTSPGVQAQGEGAVPVDWRKDIDLDFGGNQRVKGFAALREVGSTPLAGFALFRRDRLIEGSFDESYRPSYVFKQTNSYPYQRLFGELHVEGFEVSHTKDGFRWEEFEDIFLEHLKEKIEEAPLDLLAQAENYRALPSRKSIETRAEAATAAVANYVEKEVAPLLIEAKQYPTEADELPSELAPRELQSSERIVEVHDDNHQWVITLRTSVDPATEDWVSVAKTEHPTDSGDDIRRLTIDLSLAHPFSNEFLGANNENVEVLLRISTAICIALVLSEDVSAEPPESFLYYFNYLMRGALARTSLGK
ncbi:ATP-binding protein [Xanthomonas campestris]|uniref:ATP-binding protein n=3 Tax=Xanthomonas campestris TaxID=339 RepID=UPI002B23D40E|nr:ATP-binding protein [Xanthomonas campestris]MEA9710312.1 ATP-binding protein [Xanthomonas campestris]MEA9784487.1 ATP-binding protein [Xanthomonas campestris pv. raphani]MEA9819351.1 ATP-binding protein [Xanthomonas campestris pv. raphani]MEA9879871.1 ATP-binding protein [Xanthomonas campestris pv. raphani]